MINEKDEMEDRDELFAELRLQREKRLRVERVEERLRTISSEMKTLSKEDFKLKYGSPSKVWAECQYELYLARKGLPSHKTYKQ